MKDNALKKKSNLYMVIPIKGFKNLIHKKNNIIPTSITERINQKFTQSSLTNSNRNNNVSNYINKNNILIEKNKNISIYK